MTPLCHRVQVGSRGSRTISSRTNYNYTLVRGVRIQFTIGWQCEVTVAGALDQRLGPLLEVANAICNGINRAH